MCSIPIKKRGDVAVRTLCLGELATVPRWMGQRKDKRKPCSTIVHLVERPGGFHWFTYGINCEKAEGTGLKHLNIFPIFQVSPFPR